MAAETLPRRAPLVLAVLLSLPLLPRAAGAQGDLEAQIEAEVDRERSFRLALLRAEEALARGELNQAFQFYVKAHTIEVPDAAFVDGRLQWPGRTWASIVDLYSRLTPRPQAPPPLDQALADLKPSEPAAAVPAPQVPPKLEAEASFSEPSGNGALDGGEEATLEVKVANSGQGPAYGVRLEAETTRSGLSLGLPEPVQELAPGASATLALKVKAEDGVEAGTTTLVVRIAEHNGFNADDLEVEFETRPFDPPRLELASVALGGTGLAKAGETIRANLVFQHAGGTAARDVKAELVIESNDIFRAGDATADLGALEPGASAKASFEFTVNKRFKGHELPVFVALSHSRSAEPAKLPLGLRLGEAAPAAKRLSVKAAPAAAAAAPAPVDDLDVPPETGAPLDPDAVGVVIGVERYRQKGLPPVDYAARDAQAVYSYLTRSMGFDPRNVVLLKDDEAGKTDFEKYLGPWLRNHANEKSRVFVFYAGHGAPNPQTNDAYLIPYDGDPSYTEETSYPVKRLHETLAKLPAKEVTLVLDACFSGAGGRSVIAKGTRPLVNRVETGSAGPNTVVLTASGGDQISTFYPDGEHGLLTYYLLKGLRGEADSDKDGAVTTVELFGFVQPGVEREARKQNVNQIPTLTPRPEALGDRARQVWTRLK